jgi:hypothetical protein
MRKYLFGILLIFAFLQTMASKAVVSNHSYNLICYKQNFAFKQEQNPASTLPMDVLVNDEDDEDEHSESEGSFCNLIFDNHIQKHAAKVVSAILEIESNSDRFNKENQLLYILWSVFRI